jgi:hypothetical protein
MVCSGTSQTASWRWDSRSGILIFLHLSDLHLALNLLVWLHVASHRWLVLVKFKTTPLGRLQPLGIEVLLVENTKYTLWHYLCQNFEAWCPETEKQKDQTYNQKMLTTMQFVMYLNSACMHAAETVSTKLNQWHVLLTTDMCHRRTVPRACTATTTLTSSAFSRTSTTSGTNCTTCVRSARRWHAQPGALAVQHFSLPYLPYSVTSTCSTNQPQVCVCLRCCPISTAAY